MPCTLVVSYQPTWYHITEDGKLYVYCHENYKLHICYLCSDEGTPSRIPVHRRATPSSHTAGSGSGTITPTRKLTVPVNGTSPSSRPRTPTGLISPASGASSRYSKNSLFVQVTNLAVGGSFWSAFT